MTLQAVPMYLSEMSPATLRGSLNICFQLATAFGILIANCINYGATLLFCAVTHHLMVHAQLSVS